MSTTIKFQDPPTEIKRQDIRVGDIIRVTNSIVGVTIERTGIVAQDTEDHLYTSEEGCLWSAYWEGDYSFVLLARPKPELPTKEGVIIILEDSPVEKGPVPLILREGKWEYLDGDSHYHPLAVRNLKWRLAEVVAVES